MYKLGYKPDPLNNKDLYFTQIDYKLIKYGSISNTEHIIPKYTPISDQLSLNSCAGNATADALEILLGVQDPTSVKQLSRLFLYYNARVYDKNTDKDEGTFIRNCFRSLTDLGICTEQTWEYNVNKVYLQPNIMAYKEGIDNKIDSYYRIGGDSKTKCDMIEESIRANHPVVFGTMVTKGFVENYGLETVFDKPNTQNFEGAHAMVIVGVKKINNTRMFYVRNSWSKSWGYDGHCWMTENYIGSDLSADFWVPTFIEGLML